MLLKTNPSKTHKYFNLPIPPNFHCRIRPISHDRLMGKRKVDLNPDEATIPPASSKEFTSLVLQYSYSAAKANDLDTTSPIRVTPPKTPKKRKIQLPPPSPTKGKNPGYAPPSAYAHIPTPDLDRLAHNLILLFIGLNPGCPKV